MVQSVRLRHLALKGSLLRCSSECDEGAPESSRARLPGGPCSSALLLGALAP
jgi:hypothetical protein